VSHEHTHRANPTDEVLTDPHARLTAALVLSLVLWAPSGMSALRGDLDVVAAGVRYLVAFLGCRLAVSGITHLLASYRALQHVEARDVVLAPVTLARRADDTAA
jgi:hypothetical protein